MRIDVIAMGNLYAYSLLLVVFAGLVIVLEFVSKVIALREPAMLFMIIERFKDQDMLPVYKKLQHNGRMMPHGLKYVDSWVEPNFARCFQLMECDDLRLLQQWILNWRGSGTLFEIVPVVPNKDTRELFMPLLDPAKPET